MAEMRESNKRSVGTLTVDVDVDVSEALKGLKALKREANEALKVLQQLAKFLDENEDVAKNLISVFTTKELEEEIEKRKRLSK
ncbi:hypothetical protein V2J23_04050 [Geobacillus thermoleovorans]|uniref:hypothetical protein n=1 Tax=Geobacillus thermoleovorans TaxID=33941 RepID=UPI00345C280F